MLTSSQLVDTISTSSPAFTLPGTNCDFKSQLCKSSRKRGFVSAPDHHDGNVDNSPEWIIMVNDSDSGKESQNDMRQANVPAISGSECIRACERSYLNLPKASSKTGKLDPITVSVSHHRLPPSFLHHRARRALPKSFDPDEFILAWKSRHSRQRNKSDQLARPRTISPPPSFDYKHAAKTAAKSRVYETVFRLAQPRSLESKFGKSLRISLKTPRENAHDRTDKPREARSSQTCDVTLDANQLLGVYSGNQAAVLPVNNNRTHEHVKTLAARIANVCRSILTLVERVDRARYPHVEAWATQLVHGSILQCIANRRIPHDGPRISSSECPKLASALSELNRNFPTRVCFLRLLALHSATSQVSRE